MSRRAFWLLVCVVACERRGPQQTAIDAAADGPQQDAAPQLPAGALSLGRTCDGDFACGSGFCVDGVCCDTRCESACRRCDLPALTGSCARVPAGAIPRPGDCPTEPATSCGFDGTCDGEGACRQHPIGTECGAGACVDSATVGGRMICDGAGLCRPGPMKVCNPLTCDPATGNCRASCTADEHCFNRPCVNGGCYRPNIAQCLQGVECVSGHCAQGRCCSDACDRPGVSCALPSSPGTCAPIPDAAALD